MQHKMICINHRLLFNSMAEMMSSGDRKHVAGRVRELLTEVVQPHHPPIQSTSTNNSRRCSTRTFLGGCCHEACVDTASSDRGIIS